MNLVSINFNIATKYSPLLSSKGIVRSQLHHCYCCGGNDTILARHVGTSDSPRSYLFPKCAKSTLDRGTVQTCFGLWCNGAHVQKVYVIRVSCCEVLECSHILCWIIYNQFMDYLLYM